MNRKDFVRFVAKSNQIPQTAASYYVSVVLDGLAAALRQGEELSLYGFGSFKRVHHKEKTYRHPQTGELCTAPATDTIKFVPGALFEPLK